MRSHGPCWLNCICWFDALLPEEADDDDEQDYYDILGVSCDANLDDIKKAYKQRAVRLHPDKQMQRSARGAAAVAAADEFQRVKEAYETLSNPRKRAVYDVVGAETMRYVLEPGSVGSEDLLQNLMYATCCDRFKLFFLAVTLAFLLVVQPVLVCLNVDRSEGGEVFMWPWLAVFAPLWTFDVIVLVGLVCVLIMVLERNEKRKKRRGGKTGTGSLREDKATSTGSGLLGPVNEGFLRPSNLCRRVFLFTLITAAEILIALKLDGWLLVDYALVFVPLYLHEFVWLVTSAATVLRTRDEMDRMITIDELESSVLGGRRSYNDLTDDEKDTLSKTYIIVHVPLSVQAKGNSNARDGVGGRSTPCASTFFSGGRVRRGWDERSQVTESEEFQRASVRVSKAWKRMSLVVVHAMFFALLVPRLDDHGIEERDEQQEEAIQKMSWWLVFLPIWVLSGFRLFSLGWKLVPSALFFIPSPSWMFTEVPDEPVEVDATKDDFEPDEGNSQKGKQSIDDLLERAKYGDSVPAGSVASAVKKQKHPTDDGSCYSFASTLDSNEVIKVGDSVGGAGGSGGSNVVLDVGASRNQSFEVSFEGGDMECTGTAKDGAAEKDGAVDNDDDSFLFEELGPVDPMSVFWQCFQVIVYTSMACLFVGKLEGGSYSSFWVIFPFLLCVGVFVCFFGCAVFCLADVPDDSCTDLPGGIDDEPEGKYMDATIERKRTLSSRSSSSDVNEGGVAAAAAAAAVVDKELGKASSSQSSSSPSYDVRGRASPVIAYALKKTLTSDSGRSANSNRSLRSTRSGRSDRSGTFADID